MHKSKESPKTVTNGCPHPAPTNGETSRVAKSAIKTDLPGPSPLPILGWRANVARLFLNPLAQLKRLRQSYGNVVCLAQGGNGPLILAPGSERTSTIFGFGSECNRQVLSQPNLFESDSLRAPKECPWLGEAMFAANRKDRSFQRRLTLTGLDRGHLKEYYLDVIDFAEKMLDTWRPGEKICLADELERFAVNLASKIYFGQDPREHHQTFAAISREITAQLVSPTTMMPVRFPGSPYMKFLKLTQKAEASIATEIARRRASGWEGKDAFSMLLQASDTSETPLSDAELMGNAFALFVAGHEVPANALAISLYLLAQHPETAAELLDELDRELGGDPPTFEKVWRLPTLDKIFKESLRVLGPSVMIWRRLTAPAVLGSYEIPGGSEVIISPYMTHTDPELFEQPKRFLPERWDTIDPSPFEYLPFSHGARKCLGAAFAEMLLKIVISMIAQRFRLELIPKTKIDLKVTFIVSFKNGLPMIIREQDREFDKSSAEISGQMSKFVDVP